MATAPPRRNLPPEAEPWGRWIEGQLADASGTASRAAATARNAQSGVTGAIQSTGDSITTIQTVTIPQTQADLEDQIVTASTALDNKILDTRTELEADIQTAVQGAGGNWNYYSANPPTPQPGGFKDGDLWFKTDEGNKIFRRVGNAWVESPLGNAAIGELDAAKISTGLLNAARIGAGTVSADKVLIGNTSNMVPDPTFLNNQTWTTPSYVQAAGGRLSGGSILVPASSAQLSVYMGAQPEYTIPVLEGQSLRASVYYSSAITVATSNRVALFARFRNPTGTWGTPFTIVQNVGTAPANTWQRLSGNIEVPNGVTHIALGLIKQSGHNGAVRFSDPAVQLRNTGELIVDGAIDGQTITGATVQTETTEDRGVKLDRNGFRAFNAAGAQTVNIDATTGQATLVGGITTALTGSRATVRNAAPWGGMLQFQNEQNQVAGQVYGWRDDKGEVVSTSSDRIQMLGNKDGVENYAMNTVGNVVSTSFAGAQGAGMQYRGGDTSGSRSGVVVTNDGVSIDASGSRDVWINGRSVLRGAQANVALAAGWYTESIIPAPTVERIGREVFFSGTRAFRSSPMNVNGAGIYSVMTIPEGYRPSRAFVITGAHGVNGSFYAGHWFVFPNGDIQFVAFATGTMAANTFGSFIAPSAASWTVPA